MSAKIVRSSDSMYILKVNLTDFADQMGLQIMKDRNESISDKKFWPKNCWLALSFIETKKHMGMIDFWWWIDFKHVKLEVPIYYTSSLCVK